MKQKRCIWLLLLIPITFLIFDGYLMYRYSKAAALVTSSGISRDALCPDFDGDGICERIFVRSDTNQADELVVERNKKTILTTPFSMYDKESHFTRAGLSWHTKIHKLIVVGGAPHREEVYEFRGDKLVLTQPDPWDWVIIRALRDGDAVQWALYDLIQLPLLLACTLSVIFGLIKMRKNQRS